MTDRHPPTDTHIFTARLSAVQLCLVFLFFSTLCCFFSLLGQAVPVVRRFLSFSSIHCETRLLSFWRTPFLSARLLPSILSSICPGPRSHIPSRTRNGTHTIQKSKMRDSTIKIGAFVLCRTGVVRLYVRMEDSFANIQRSVWVSE